jgi:hypothetical protein
LRDVPEPNAEQQARFLDHVCIAHSWYKAYNPPSTHIHFAVFLWRGSGFAPQHRTWGNYRELHGFLGYGWRYDPDTQFDTDTHNCVELTPELLVAGRVVVEAYIAGNPWPTRAGDEIDTARSRSGRAAVIESARRRRRQPEGFWPRLRDRRRRPSRVAIAVATGSVRQSWLSTRA